MVICVLAASVATFWSLATPAPRASAHERTDIDALLDVVTPHLPTGVEVMTAPSVAQEILVTNPTAVPLTVLGRDGTPFLRLDDAGVQANLSSPDWQASNDPESASQGTAQGSLASPRWEVVTGDDSWAWFDPRIQPPASLPPSVAGATRPTTIGHWQLPIVYGTQRALVQGRFQYEPVVGSFRVEANTAPAGLVVSSLQGRLPGLFVFDKAGRTIIVLGLDGRPFLRLNHDGTDVNPSSPNWAVDRQARGLPAQQTPTASAWVRISNQPTASWLDPRLDHPAVPPSNLGQPGVVSRWRIPIDVDTQGLALTGTVNWVPALGSRPPGTPWWIVWTVAGGGAIGAVALSLILALRFRT